MGTSRLGHVSQSVALRRAFDQSYLVGAGVADLSPMNGTVLDPL